jgi:hypothetical protein
MKEKDKKQTKTKDQHRGERKRQNDHGIGRLLHVSVTCERIVDIIMPTTTRQESETNPHIDYCECGFRH